MFTFKGRSATQQIRLSDAAWRGRKRERECKRNGQQRSARVDSPTLVIRFSGSILLP